MPHRVNILIVEDHEPTADRLKALLESCDGITVTVAGTLQDGIRQSQEQRPDITLLDLLLPDVKSWRETVAAIHLFKPPVIVLTELDNPDAKVAAFEAGAEDVLNKGMALKIASLLISAVASARMRRLSREQADVR